MNSAHRARRGELLRGLYGDDADAIETRAMQAVAAAPHRHTADPTQSDAWLIAYADQFRRADESPLETLRAVLDGYFAPEINGVHVLPFHPFSSDRGFSVIDYAVVAPSFGSWADIEALASDGRLMADAVLNHMSSEGPWFQAFLAGEQPYGGFFRTVDPDADLADVVRPRTSPLVTTFDTADGPRHVWTTFSADQVDLDFRNPAVLLAALDVLLRYHAAGASAIRLDAIAFIWKVEGSTSINLDGTHDVIEVLRGWLDEVDPGLMLVTETNMPHAENVAYLGRPGRREAQAVYQFALPPLLLHVLSTTDPAALVEWAAGLGDLPSGRTYMNFTSSHDGVGLRPVEDLLPAHAVHDLTALCERAGGVINWRRLADGTDAPYELASTWYALMTAIDSDPDRALARHLLSQAFVLALRGIPLLYTHVLLASDNDLAAYQQSGVARDLNRADFDPVAELESTLADSESRSARAVAAIRSMLRMRSTSEAFHPDAGQRLDRVDSVVLVERFGADGENARVYLNVGVDPVEVPPIPGKWPSVVVPGLGSVWLMPPTVADHASR